MTRRDDLLARRAHLLPIYQNPDPAHDLQHIEVESELAAIAEELKAIPREPREESRRPRERHDWRDHRAAATGRD